MDDNHGFRVLIVGAGVAGLEAALALWDLAGERISTTLLSSEPDFVYRPMRVGEPFSYPAARHYPLDEIAHEIGAGLAQDACESIDTDRRIVHTESGQELSYDALLLALGARLQPHFEHALTIDDRHLDDQLHGLIQDIEAGYTHSVALLVPPRMAWPLPIYELALMTARRAWDMNLEVQITIVTSEDRPLAVFGAAAGEAVEEVLAHHRIVTITSAHAETPAVGEVLIHPGTRTLRVDRVVALPELIGPALRGVPATDAGFIPVDPQGRVRGLEHVFAAGDAVDFPVKHGGIAAQQADVAAQSIAAMAGIQLKSHQFDPVIQGILIGGQGPLYMRADHRRSRDEL